jgi:hypothetical protein
METTGSCLWRTHRAVDSQLFRHLWRDAEAARAIRALHEKLPGPVAFLAFPFETMWMRARAGTLKVGDPAPDFSLQKLHEDERIQLSALHQKQPVVLIFGSYT